jgi:transposase InsO family protein
MAYTIKPCLVTARKTALLMLLNEQLPTNVVARKCGVHRSTIWRWYRKWQKLNKCTSQVHHGRPNRQTKFCWSYYKWQIATLSSRPKTCSHALSQSIVNRVLELRYQLKRCAEVIWYYLAQEGVKVSLSSVRRILARHHQYDRKKYQKKVYRKNIKRPLAERPGDLVQIDTVHLVDTYTGKRKYVYTVLDLYTRMAYARVYERIYQIPALETLLIAEKKFSFGFNVVQSDNGLEFGKVFRERLEANGKRKLRHSRPHRPNDNAHIERFNRTLREECIGHYMSSNRTAEQIQRKLNRFLDYYNNERVHLSLQCKTPTEYYSDWLQRC